MNSEEIKKTVEELVQEYNSQVPSWVMELNGLIRTTSVNQSYYINRVHQEQGIKNTQITILTCLLQNGGTAQVQDLSREFPFTKQALATALNAMEERGLLERLPDREDKRKRWIRITPAGVDCIREVLAIRKPTMEAAAASLTEEEARQACQTLKKLNDFYVNNRSFR